MGWSRVEPAVMSEPIQIPVLIHLFNEGPLKGVIRTQGHAAQGLPELEIRGVPLFLAPDATRLLGKVSSYMLANRETIKLGDTMAVGNEQARFMFEKLVAEENRWTLTDAAITGVCADPACTKNHAEIEASPAATSDAPAAV